MDLRLHGKSALVTGSTAGIGLAIAAGLAAEGAAVIVNGRSRNRVDEAIAKIRSQHPTAGISGIDADVASSDGIQRLTQAIADVDILVNNAGIFEARSFDKITDADWERFFQTNVMSGVRLSRFYLPKMLARNWGRIVFISSESALQIPAEMIHYGMTKTAQLAVARGLAELTAATGVTVNSVLPGPTASEGVELFVKQLADRQGKSPDAIEKEFFQSARPSSLLKRFATSEEVANMVVYVCSPLASATNGASLRVDGGVVRSIA
ncbi:MAG TPA: SDR family NAD(P)-dependent oxidoreductase [Tepidisphaeraceae bacterium]|nr:SDR family NAD(P)-dependent oxidoreductase [Tepidisphaeraceae bacterium]